jgi:hypothetical protein
MSRQNKTFRPRSMASMIAGADERYERARAVALDALVGASGGGIPVWHRAELYDQ